ncbi:hypothetical protein CC1G_02420 [Coprinopsis cinerea okayama7|uniref:Uncharacterized protein n=1 Tax=Coprinopsis cinerea (strain Okayama-7 / 130 / ATCC MYA-4618 / FGSC 9003) TaxID=240176 RepID=A8NBG0_COPC7|nr:hypothetical protein CC1G_02420 [Coprinopsis cinerea okayama7\|eukprot:XP_001832158.1 hypothetical protein CC1G_02420 [Coprinopsis cinerea okayama7\
MATSTPSADAPPGEGSGSTKEAYDWHPTHHVQKNFLRSKMAAFLQARAEKERTKKKEPVSNFFKSVYTEVDVRWPTYESEELAEAAEVARLAAEGVEGDPDQSAELRGQGLADEDQVTGTGPQGNGRRGKSKKTVKEIVEESQPREAPPANWDVGVWQAARRKKVYRWFYNQVPKFKRKGPKIELVMAPVQRRSLSDWQLFSKDFYGKKVRGAVEEEAKRLEAAGEEVELVSLRQDMTIKAWKDADEETRAHVFAKKAEIAEAKAQAAAAMSTAMDVLSQEEIDARTPEEYHEFLAILPELLDAFFTTVSAKSGWSFTVLAGGPDPSKEGGAIRTMSYHHGVTPRDQTFRQILPPRQFADIFMKPYSGFLHLVYPKEVRQSRELANGDSSALDLLLSLNPSMVNEDLPEDQIEDAQAGAARIRHPKGVAPDESSATPPTKSGQGDAARDDGELGREKTEGDAKGKKSAGRKGSSKSKGKGKASDAVTQVPSQESSEDTSPSGNLVRQVVNPVVGSGMLASVNVAGPSSSVGTRGEVAGQSLHVEDGNLVGEIGGGQLGFAASSGVDGGMSCQLFPPDDMVFGTGSGFVETGSSGYGVLPVPNFNPSAYLPPPGSLSALLHDFGAVDLLGQQAANLALQEGRDESGGNVTSEFTSAPLPDTRGIASSDVSAGVSSAPAIANEARVSEGEASTSALSLSAVPDKRGLEEGDATQGREKRARRMNTRQGAPAWVESGQAYLALPGAGLEWASCIETWSTFETRNAILDTGSVRLPKPSIRPKILSQWLAKKKFHDALGGEDEVEEFAKAWLVWWNGIQPAWRMHEGEEVGLPKPISTGKDLSGLKKPGFCGLFSVLVGLRWWASAKKSPVKWEAAVADVKACLEELGGR